MMLVIAKALPAGDSRVKVLDRLAQLSAQQAHQEMWATGFAGSHFLSSYAMLYQEALLALARRVAESS